MDGVVAVSAADLDPNGSWPAIAHVFEAHAIDALRRRGSALDVTPRAFALVVFPSTLACLAVEISRRKNDVEHPLAACGPNHDPGAVLCRVETAER